MSNKIVSKRQLTDSIYLMEIEAPRVAKSSQPGQFIIINNDEKGERIPLTIADYDREKGTVTIVFQTVGASTKKLAMFEENDFVMDVIIGARTKELIILEDDMKKVAKNVYVSTDDGTYGFNGRVTDLLKDLVDNQGKKYDQAIVIGPMIMMKFMCQLTKELNIPTIVSLNTIMIDGTGMCGGCRVSVGNETKFACVDGPEFDGHLVDFDQAMRRQSMYKTQEGRAMLKLEEGDSHQHSNCGCGGNK